MFEFRLLGWSGTSHDDGHCYSTLDCMVVDIWGGKLFNEKGSHIDLSPPANFVQPICYCILKTVGIADYLRQVRTTLYMD